MTTKNQEICRIIRLYKEETGEQAVDMHDAVRYAVRLGWPLPKPVEPLEQLAAQFSQAAREEIRQDKKTGRSYRANHAVPTTRHGRQLSYMWWDIDDAPREPMRMSLINRREQIVGDSLQLSLDADHWNSIHPDEEPIQIPLDFTDDVEWRKNAPEERSA